VQIKAVRVQIRPGEQRDGERRSHHLLLLLKLVLGGEEEAHRGARI